MDWYQYHLKKVRVRFKPRLKLEYKILKPGVKELDGTVLEVVPSWLMSEEDPYPGEWALISTNSIKSVILDIHWIASGDVEFIEEIK
jgi:hypothetical protein